MIVTITLNPAIDQTATIDSLQVGSVNKAEKSVQTLGGKGINVARVLADLGFSVMATGLMGNKSRELFSEYLNAHQISNGFIELEGTVRTNIKLVNRFDSEVTDVNFPGFKASASILGQILTTLDQYPTGTLVCVGGSLPLGISAESFREFLASIKSSGFRLAVDTSGEALKKAIKVQPDLIKPNIHELSELAERSLNSEEALAFARELVAQGIGQVVLSCGAEGAWFVAEDSEVFAIPGKVNVVSTVGAGDSMMAGCLSALDQEASVVRMAKLATACGMKAVSQPGVGEASMDNLEPLMAEVQVFNHSNGQLSAVTRN